MMQLYTYLYYKWYTIFVNFKPGDIPEWKAAIAISIAMTLYLIMIVACLIDFTPDRIFVIKIVVGAGFSIIIILNYFLFIKDKMYLKIEKRFHKESRRQRIMGTVFAVVFVIGCVPFAILFLMYILPPLKNGH